jgi:hypothetical protein
VLNFAIYSISVLDCKSTVQYCNIQYCSVGAATDSAKGASQNRCYSYKLFLHKNTNVSQNISKHKKGVRNAIAKHLMCHILGLCKHRFAMQPL